MKNLESFFVFKILGTTYRVPNMIGMFMCVCVDSCTFITLNIEPANELRLKRRFLWETMNFSFHVKLWGAYPKECETQKQLAKRCQFNLLPMKP